MRSFIEHFIVAVIAVGMAFMGYWLMGRYELQGHRQNFIELHDIGWTVWTAVVSVATWLWLYRMCRHLHWLVLPVIGVFSPIIGAALFVIPCLWMPFVVLWDYAVVIFPTGIACGFLVSVATLSFRPHGVLSGNV
ncbi:MAG: hypothetical protein R3F13_02845 [Prosthecobacter sp.]